MQTQCFSTTMTDLFRRFQQEFLATNTPLMDINVIQHYFEYASSWGPCALFLQSLLAIYATLVLFYRQKKQSSSFAVFLTAEMAALLLTFFPMFLPFKSARYVLGLSSFVMFMSLHSRLHDTHHLQADDNVFGHLVSTFFHDVRYKLVHKIVPTMSNFLCLLFFCPYFTMFVMMDGCMYLMNDWIPDHVSSANGMFICQALAASMWICFGILQVLDTEAAILCCLGYPLPMDARHKNPLMSVSFSEFWGTRWNPLIGKLLQV